MIHPAHVVSIHPYFKAKPGKLAEAKALLPAFIERTRTETANLYYDFTLRDEVIFCRESYAGADGLLAHLKNVGETLEAFLKLVEVLRVEVHGASVELDKLRGPLAALNPEWFVFETGVTR
jgi:quinol monooxygenase YgiN